MPGSAIAPGTAVAANLEMEHFQAAPAGIGPAPVPPPGGPIGAVRPESIMVEEQPVSIHPRSATSPVRPNDRASAGLSGRRPADRRRPGPGAPSPLPVQLTGTAPAPRHR